MTYFSVLQNGSCLPASRKSRMSEWFVTNQRGLQMSEITYVPDQRLLKAADAITNLEPCAFAGKVTRDQVLLALCEIAGVCPESSRDDESDAEAG
jgi:hypothetical protein